ncbi:histidine phosphatase family protein [Nocardioides sp. GY 10113]|uniref:histidine phosphatase family protein n=1 Tax=Nocardioides sp. GY 10113 TaxID=2569761 RepID=UPI0010A7D56C|nr:histidine phosphatase family protein [Nocardioides sp. GY 10113]TIC79757.1 histidine phosphatase family protein [Nocardioides sp. GY 10113]TIC84915.1 histidine phosphatase family protein [Nocardioides sp. GY 10113]
MPRRLVLLRHGQTSWNAAKRIQGHLDAPLNDTGRLQAKAVAPVVAGFGPAAIWSSDLSRARDTAQAVADETGLVPSYDARLREFHLGEREGLTHAEYAAVDPEGFARFKTGDWSHVVGAESAEAVAERFVAALHDAVAALGTDGTGVVVSHGAATRTGIVTFLGWPLELGGELRGMENCGYAVLEERSVGGWRLAAYNLTA